MTKYRIEEIPPLDKDAVASGMGLIIRPDALSIHRYAVPEGYGVVLEDGRECDLSVDSVRISNDGEVSVALYDTEGLLGRVVITGIYRLPEPAPEPEKEPVKVVDAFGNIEGEDW